MRLRSTLLAIFFVQGSGLCADNVEPGINESVTNSQSLSAYLNLIMEMEAKYGAYNPELIQVFVKKGHWHHEQVDYLAAAESYRSALHISKVNKGLHNFAQIELAELLSHALIALEDWQSLDDNLQYLLWLYRRNFTGEDDRLLAMIERVTNWYMQAYKLHRGGEAVSYLLKADELIEETTRRVAKYNGKYSQQLINLLQRTATINYQIANDIEDTYIMSYSVIQDVMMKNKRATPYFNEAGVRDFYFDQSFYKGKRAFDRILEIHKRTLPDSAVEYAKTLVYQGDYYLSLGRKWHAMGNYEKAHKMLQIYSVASEHVASLFGQPRQVEPFIIPGKEIVEIGQQQYIDAQFDVLSTGWPSHIRIVARKPKDNDQLRTRGKYAIASTRFRPRFEQGEPVNTEDVTLRYIFRH
jgi:tetratricopeptide (TPR) repeat protein